MVGHSEVCAVRRCKADVSAPRSSFQAPSSNACPPPETANLLAAATPGSFSDLLLPGRSRPPKADIALLPKWLRRNAKP